jgi:hypothetical protein
MRICRVNVINHFTVRKLTVPEVADKLEARFLSEPASFGHLDGHYLASLAWAYYAQGRGSKDFFVACAARARELGKLYEHDAANLATALAAAGVPMPDVKREAQAAE